jgi:hypothetical protein
MLTIDHLSLPKKLPHPDAIKSWGENEHSYDPEFWEFQYELYRYLSRIGDDELASVMTTSFETWALSSATTGMSFRFVRF